MAKEKRIFLGVAIPGIISHEILALQEERPGIKWVIPSNLHITLRFLGEQVESIIDFVTTCIKLIKLAPTVIELNQMEFWQPNILNISVKNNAQLTALKTRLDDVLQGRIIMPEESKDFKPHVTIARIKKSVNDSDINALVQKYNQTTGQLSFACAEYCLYESKNTNDEGRIYEKLICV